MGIVDNVGFNTFPKQSNHVGQLVNVCFHYDTSNIIQGTVVRDDIEAPFVMIIELSDKRFVLSTE